MADPLYELHNKRERDAARRSEHAGVADDLILIIGGSDAYYNPPSDKEGPEAYNQGFHNAKK